MTVDAPRGAQAEPGVGGAEHPERLPRVSPEWLDLREPADAAARAGELVEPVRRGLAPGQRVAIHDLGAGTGSMGRWLAPLLPGSQHWVLYDRDPDLLARAATGLAAGAADGAPVTARTLLRDVTRLTPRDLDGASLVTASALLDMLTAEEIERVVTACAAARCRVLLTISVIGRVEFDPPDPLDGELMAAFNAHQRRTTPAGRRLLGPDALDTAVAAFRRRGARVLVRPSPWRLGPAQAALAVEWLRGWLSAACEQSPELAAAAARYARRRLSEAAAGRLEIVVHHSDLLASCE